MRRIALVAHDNRKKRFSGMGRMELQYSYRS